MGGWKDFVFVAAVLVVGCVDGAAERGSLSGVARDAFSGMPIPGASVRVEGEAEVETDLEGVFEIEVPAGTHEVVVRAPGYFETSVVDVVVDGGGVAEVEVELQLEAPGEEEIQAQLEGLDLRRALRDRADDPGLRPEVAAHLRGEIPFEELIDRRLRIDLGDGIGGLRAGLGTPPATIRIWRRGVDGSSSSCRGRVDRIPFESYVKGVLPHEWIVSWPRESLRAGSLAIRTYSWRWIAAGGKYDCADLDDTTASQVYRDSRVAVASAAVDHTRGQGIVRSGRLVSGEYSAENGSPTADGITDSVCRGRAVFGHGRGMCQWGTSRWASAGRTHVWMAEHYWPGASVVIGCSPSREVCDGRDNDCDGRSDEGVTNACGRCGAVPREVCDGRDNDCDGTTDENVCDRASATGDVLPMTVDLGTPLPAHVTLTNAGGTTWRAGAYTVLVDADGAEVTAMGEIATDVAPGGRVEVDVAIVPRDEGPIVVRAGIAKDGTRFESLWTGRSEAIRPPFAASFADVSAPASLIAGESADGYLVVKNEGREPWPEGTRVAADTSATVVTMTDAALPALAAGESTRVAVVFAASDVDAEIEATTTLQVQQPDGTVASWPTTGRELTIGVRPRAGTRSRAVGADRATTLDGGCSASGGRAGTGAWAVLAMALIAGAWRGRGRRR